MTLTIYANYWSVKTIIEFKELLLFNFLTHRPSVGRDLEFARSWKYIASFERSLSLKLLNRFSFIWKWTFRFIASFWLRSSAKNVIYVPKGSKCTPNENSRCATPLHGFSPLKILATKENCCRKAVALISYSVFIVRWNRSHAPSRDVGVTQNEGNYYTSHDLHVASRLLLFQHFGISMLSCLYYIRNVFELYRFHSLLFIVCLRIYCLRI